MWKLPINIDPRTYENFLFNRAADPEMNQNLWDAELDKRSEILLLLRNLLDEEGCPPEQLERLGLTD